ncbi:MAG: ATP-binding cassette domain-containing protein, partial [Bacilli bacterium]
MNLLQLKDVNKYYKLDNSQTFHALKNINVSFNRGELVSIIGESGSGKSTMMNLIGGLDSNFEGELLIEGKNIGQFTERELDEYRKNKIGFVFQSCNLIPHLSILDNVTI